MPFCLTNQRVLSAVPCYLIVKIEVLYSNYYKDMLFLPGQNSARDTGNVSLDDVGSWRPKLGVNVFQYLDVF